jgi:hypothetical protein
MSAREDSSRTARRIEVARRFAEYAIAIGLAVLCGYGIVLWRW